MQNLLEFAPLVAFLITYYAFDIYRATAVLMIAMLLLLLVSFLRTRHISRMQGLSAALVFVFGGATLWLHDQRFIQWKPTIFFWLASLAFLLSRWIGTKTLTERALGSLFAGELSVSAAQWRTVNAWWVIFYAVLGAVNLYVAFNASERAWVNFKVFGLTALTLLFVMGQVLWLKQRSSTVQS
jgi:intracellular septation protein